MEVQEQDSLGRWDGLGSRDAVSRTEAMENIRQVIMRKVEAIEPIPPVAESSPASGSPPNSELNDILAHLLMLSKRCPFEDVRERSTRLLQAVQNNPEHVSGYAWKAYESLQDPGGDISLLKMEFIQKA